MQIARLHLEDFRSIASADLAFGSGLTALVGPNGGGKTSVLEAVALLAGGRSFRTSKLATVVRMGQAAARVQGFVDRGGSAVRLGATVPAIGVSKSFTVDSAPTSLVRFAGILRIVVFTPDHLQLVTAEPQHRRTFLDSILARQSAHLLGSLLQLVRILKQRNRLLLQIRRGEAARAELEAWDGALVQAGMPVAAARLQLVDELNALLPETLATLDPRPRSIELRYEPTIPADADETAWLTAIRAAQDRDLAVGKTTIGPHRDGVTMVENGRELALYGSRGEQRTAVLALKLAEFRHTSTQLGEAPVLLLDDVLSELDEAHQRALLDAARETQTLLTSASQPGEIRALLPEAAILELPEAFTAGT